jgi:L-glyceraldehyde 3-phosphate reductase
MYNPDSKRYDNMIYRRCGNSGLMLPAISLGLWQNFGEFNSYESCKERLLKAFDFGITHFDLANNYGPPAGAAEEVVGKLLSEELKPYRDELLISTKAGYWGWDGPYGDHGSRKYMLASLDRSLKRLGLDYVDIFYSHGRDVDTPLEETMGVLASAVKQGKALYVGISSYSTEDTKKASEILKSYGVPLLIHQPCYNMLDRWVEDTGLLDLLGDEGIGSIAFCPLAQGLLTGKYLKGIPEDSRAKNPNGVMFDQYAITEENVEKVRKLNEIAENRGQTMAQMAISWLLKDERLTSVIIGASKLSQIEENIKALQNIKFSDDELSEIAKIIK